MYEFNPFRLFKVGAQKPSSCDYLFDCMKKDAPGLYKCENCEFTAFLKVNLTIHTAMFHHSTGKNFTFDNFLTSANETYNMTNILKFHHCLDCDFGTYSLLLFARHQFDHHAVKPKPKMPKIESKIPRKTRAHINYRAFKRNELFECSQCNAKTRSAYSLMKHIEVLHGFVDEFKVFTCEKCPFKSQYEGALKKHLKRHEAESSDEWFTCDQCPYKSKQQNYLQRHVKANHTDSKKYGCEHCDYKAKTKCTLKDHVISRHTALENINWFLCELCAYKCKHKRNLMQHKRGKHKLKV
ncbi:zinc finger Y-chromosomal protein [Tribolium castaneum]|uniref:RE1-silencing transcription factor A-like Protein n=1 Tax=Tribolium castaneum TaxID=7070 RepID=D6WQZ6_TRICA|nr:PREDICTED: zinc finger Y-chromosomal protein isoform X2 [Tribolium castaneum]EFA06529.1 RE1-silencing transcription factor A-like Protein [Tribolium castaneum]|eukprot:XP_001811673.1 PREDICTED: zinc finger Y-chromosomal protein isoform X2 [Tribolium castaneum]